MSSFRPLCGEATGRRRRGLAERYQDLVDELFEDRIVDWTLADAVDLAAGDADTEDLFVEISRSLDKNLWLVEAHAQA